MKNNKNNFLLYIYLYIYFLLILVLLTKLLLVTSTTTSTSTTSTTRITSTKVIKPLSISGIRKELKESNNIHLVLNKKNKTTIIPTPIEEVKTENKPIVENKQEEIVKEPENNLFVYSKDIDEGDAYLLAKIAMCEAEMESIEVKKHVIICVLNRVHSDEFPNTIQEVIFQPKQFSPVNPGGRWYYTEPNQSCFTALTEVLAMTEDISKGCLYFDGIDSSHRYHDKHLELLYQIGNMRFYK